TLTFTNGGTVDASGGASAISIDSGSVSNANLTVNLDTVSAASATIKTGSSGSIAVAPVGTGSVTIQQTGNPSSPTNTSTLYLTGGPVTFTTSNTSATAMSVAKKVVVSTDGSITINMNGGTLANNGTIATTAGGS